MKQGKSLITFVITALAVMLAIYFGVYVFNALNEPYRTTLVYTYTSNDSVEIDGLIVREETVFPAQAGIVEIIRGEGERVGTGQTVALAYRDSQAQTDQTQIQALEQEIQLLEYAISQSGSIDSAARLDEDILQSVVELRSAAALGNYADLENQVRAVKSNVLKRGYTYGDGVTAAELKTQLQELNGQLSLLNQRSAQATTRVTAGKPGIFSSLVDGYESQLSPATLSQLTPESLDTLMKNPANGESSGLGKLITSNRWYFAANLPSQSAQRLHEGETAMLRFTGDFTQDVDMSVEQIGPAQGDQTLVIFSSSRYLSDTTLLRRQRVELIFDSWSGLRIPKSALRLVEETQEDEETHEVTVTTKLGVYTLVNGRTEFKEAEVIIEGSDYYVVRPVGADRKILRAGDEVITQATGLQDGQLLEY